MLKKLGEFVVNISTWDTRHQMNEILVDNVKTKTDELLETGLTPISSINVNPKGLLNHLFILNAGIIKLLNCQAKTVFTMLCLVKLLEWVY